jgi:hypothetical protein
MSQQEFVPQTPIHAKQSYASLAGFADGTRRLISCARRDRLTWGVWALAFLGLLLVWTVLGAWYVIIFAVPVAIMLRLLRWQQRKGA